LACGTGAAAYAYQVQVASDADVLVLADKLRHVTVAYSSKGPVLQSCNIRAGADARVIDQMMCSLVASCLPNNWSGSSRMTRCVNARVDALEQGVGKRDVDSSMSPFPDQWLAQGLETVSKASLERTSDDTRSSLGEVRAGQWEFTELATGTGKAGDAVPRLLRWRKCIRPEEAANGLAMLLEPPPYSSRVRYSLPLECDWETRRSEARVTGSMKCRTAAGASTQGILRGEVTPDEVVFRRERRWSKPGDWATASFSTNVRYKGSCMGSAEDR
jgi:hypothetical protein